MTRKDKYVYFFGEGKAEGRADMKDLLGGKGANLAEMTRLGIPVPAGFTISTAVCTAYYKSNKSYPAGLQAEVERALRNVERIMKATFGDEHNPLLVSIRSGARSSMPGMMETILNIGLTSKTVPGLIAKTGNKRFVYDSYRRLIMMYADVVMEKAAGLEPAEGQGIRVQLEHEMETMKRQRKVASDADLTADDLHQLCEIFKNKVQDILGTSFPDHAQDQLWGGIGAVFRSWTGKRAVHYRRIEGIPDDWGTAVNVQAMVFGNTGEHSGTGVGFTRNPATGENRFYGEWLPNAQGEDVVAGIRTPLPINHFGKTDATRKLMSLEEAMPKIYRELDNIRKKLERHYRDMQDIEFTIQDGKLWLLQTRTGKRTGMAAIQMAVDMASERLISRSEALMRVKPSHIDELLHPMIDPTLEAHATILATGLPAGPGAATGRIVFTADDAEAWVNRGETVVLVRNETSPEDVHGIRGAEAILTAKGGMTSHAALVARGWGKCCIVGCGSLDIDSRAKVVSVKGKKLHEGDWITLNGTKGRVYEGKIPLLPAKPERNKAYKQLMQWADATRRLGVRSNADTPADAALARSFGAEGIGLCRTEHMFFDPERIRAMREMIVAETTEERRQAVMKLLPYQKQDFIGILEAMRGLPVTIRLLDPPLHEFVNLDQSQIADLAKELGVSQDRLEARVSQLHELNPMLGHRGCRLGITYPEISEMQARAIFEAAAELTKRRVKVFPEVMIPLVGVETELADQRAIVERVAQEVHNETRVTFPYRIGTMIEIPRACVVADRIAEYADFFSFGTNDLTQTTFGYSRDDFGSFLPGYLKKGILEHDPFQIIDREGVGQLINTAVKKGRAARKDLSFSVCGEHGCEPLSVEFWHEIGIDYVSCSPFRVAVSRLAAAQAAITSSQHHRAKRRQAA
ncbi:MAG TPA: pyruvate, phosphate dikinase [Thermodesulfobacteriota bacterium]|nr:pyruvate, phosphate dikinase [Thermodesulfobacteriota bacterium]